MGLSEKELNQLKKDSYYARYEMKDDLTKGAYIRWLNKDVLKEEKIFEVKEELLSKITKPSYGSVEISELDSKKCILIKSNNDVENMNPRPGCGITIEIKEKDLTAYNRIKFQVYLKVKNQQNMYFHFNVANDGCPYHQTASVYANEWNTIVYELEDSKRDKVKHINITPFLFGSPAESDGNIEIYINDFFAQHVEEEYILGWDLENRIAYSHLGYFSNKKKIALAQEINNDYFDVIEAKTGKEYRFNINKKETNLGKYIELDFSKLNKKGEYYLLVDNRKTDIFLINNNPYDEAILKSLNFLRNLRCGEDVVGVHGACHLNCRSYDEDGKSVPIFGGWHDAGDLSQFEIPTAEMTHALVDLANVIDDKDYKSRILEEAKVGAQWLLRTTFHNGKRALAISYKLWRDNLLDPSDPGVKGGIGENGPFENFLSSAALSACSVAFKELDPIFASWCLDVSKEDFEFGCSGYKSGIYTKRWGPNIDSVVCGHGILAACNLYKITNDEKYVNIAKDYAKIVMKCQQTKEEDWEKPIKGFFYEDVKHEYILSYEHRGHEQSPIQGMCALYEMLPNDKDSNKWKKCIKLYRDFVKDTMFITEPFKLVIGNLYDVNKINMSRVTLFSANDSVEEARKDLIRQIKQGYKLSNSVYLRRMPIAIQRRGYHATLLSKTKGISCVAKALKDKELMQICVDQLEWCLGKNPFATSSMYGCGNNYHPLYVAYSKQMIGALPVGFETKGDKDEPYWPTVDNAVYKEIWGHTTGKYLWVLADIL